MPAPQDAGRKCPAYQLNICKADYSDIAAIRQIAKTHSETMPFFHIAYCNKQRFERGDIFVVWHEKTVLGFAVLRFFKSRPQIEIDIIGIAADWRNKSIGTYFINQLFDKYPDKAFVLDVREFNRAAIRFYLRNGFNEIGKSRRKGCVRMYRKGNKLIL